MSECDSDPLTLRFILSKIEALDRFCVTNFAQAKERVDMALAASDKAIVKAEAATEKRFEGVNEFRAALGDQANRLMPRAEYDVQHRALEEKVDNLNKIVSQNAAITRGKREGIGSIGAVIIGSASVVGVLIALGTLLVIFFRH